MESIYIMSTESIYELLDEYSKNPYVESTILMSKVGEPIASNESNKLELQIFAPLASLTYEGAQELANTVGYNFHQLDLEMSNGSRIVIRSLREKFLLAVHVHKYDDRVKDEIESLGNKVSESMYLL